VAARPFVRRSDRNAILKSVRKLTNPPDGWRVYGRSTPQILSIRRTRRAWFDIPAEKKSVVSEFTQALPFEIAAVPDNFASRFFILRRFSGSKTLLLT
jgi:hypothetical protein